MAKERTHVLDNRDELIRYLRGAMLAFGTAVSEQVGEKLKLTQEQIYVLDEVIDNNMQTLGDNIKCACGEYHALVEEGKIEPDDQYTPIPGTVEKLRKNILAQVEEIEKFYELED